MHQLFVLLIKDTSSLINPLYVAKEWPQKRRRYSYATIQTVYVRVFCPKNLIQKVIEVTLKRFNYKQLPNKLMITPTEKSRSKLNFNHSRWRLAEEMKSYFTSWTGLATGYKKQSTLREVYSVLYQKKARSNRCFQ